MYAEGGSKLRGHEVEDTVAVTLRFANGAVGTIIASDAAPSPWGWELGTGENPLIPATGRNCLRFVGTEGRLRCRASSSGGTATAFRRAGTRKFTP